MTVRVTVDRMPLLLRVMRLLTKNEVVFGFPEETATARTADPGEPAPPSNATIGYLMETGDDARNIPARPFMQPGLDAALPEIIDRMKLGAKQAVLLDFQAIDQLIKSSLDGAAKADRA